MHSLESRALHSSDHQGVIKRKCISKILCLELQVSITLFLPVTLSRCVMAITHPFFPLHLV